MTWFRGVAVAAGMAFVVLGCSGSSESSDDDSSGFGGEAGAPGGTSSGSSGAIAGGSGGEAGEATKGGAAGTGASGGEAGDAGNGGASGNGGRTTGGAGGMGGSGGGTAPASIDELLTTCPSAAEVAAIDADFQFVFDNVTPFGDVVCTAGESGRELTRQHERVYQAFRAMKALEFDEPLPWTDMSLYDWFAGTVDGIAFEEAQSYCCSADPDGMGVFLHLRLGQDSTFFDTDLWVNSSGLGLLNMIDVMVHEARHANIGNHTCPDVQSDRTYAEHGAWATVYDLHLWLAYHADPCFLRPTLPADPSHTGQLFDADAYQLESLDDADRTVEVRFCEVPPPVTDPVANPLPTCQ